MVARVDFEALSEFLSRHRQPARPAQGRGRGDRGPCRPRRRSSSAGSTSRRSARRAKRLTTISIVPPEPPPAAATADGAIGQGAEGGWRSGQEGRSDPGGRAADPASGPVADPRRQGRRSGHLRRTLARGSPAAAPGRAERAAGAAAAGPGSPRRGGFRRFPTAPTASSPATGIASGSVGVTILVETDGSVSNCRIARSSGDRAADAPDVRIDPAPRPLRARARPCGARRSRRTLPSFPTGGGPEASAVARRSRPTRPRRRDPRRVAAVDVVEKGDRLAVGHGGQIGDVDRHRLRAAAPAARPRLLPIRGRSRNSQRPSRAASSSRTQPPL